MVFWNLSIANDGIEYTHSNFFWVVFYSLQNGGGISTLLVCALMSKKIFKQILSALQNHLQKSLDLGSIMKVNPSLSRDIHYKNLLIDK